MNLIDDPTTQGLPTRLHPDKDSNDEGMALVTVEGDGIGLSLSLRRNGDIKIWVAPKEMSQIVDALVKAQRMLEGQENENS